MKDVKRRGKPGRDVQETLCPLIITTLRLQMEEGGEVGGDSAEIEIKRLTRCEGEIGGVMEAGDGLKELIEWMKGRGGG